MIWPVVISAFTLGLVSSTHCIGMCGPLAMALPLGHLKTSGRRFSGVMLYNAGRISSYLLIGALFGWLGRSLLVPGIQKWVAIVGGGLMIIISLLTAMKGSGVRFPFVQQIFKPVYLLLNYCMGTRRLTGIYLLGLANGLLPCGLVYIAATAAFMGGTVSNAMLFMALYGLGTLPAMALLSLMGYMISMPARNLMKKLTPCIILLTGTLLLVRGLDIHIPFISSWPIPGLHENAASCIPLK